MTAIRRAGILLRGLSSAVILVVLVVGVPAMLLGTVGNPIPDQWTWTSPLTTGRLAGPARLRRLGLLGAARDLRRRRTDRGGPTRDRALRGLARSCPRHLRRAAGARAVARPGRHRHRSDHHRDRNDDAVDRAR